MFTFSGPELIIYIAVNSYEFNAQTLYSDWKRWSQLDKNLTFPQAFRSIGGEYISNTKTIAPYIELLNGWRLKPWSGDYTLNVDGNLFATGGLNPFLGADSGTVLLSLETTGNALAIDTGSSLNVVSAGEVWAHHDRTLTSSPVSELDFARMQDQLNTLQSAIEFAINGNTVDVNDTKLMLTDAQHRVKYEGAHVVFNKPTDP
jgi:hypothetical protein